MVAMDWSTMMQNLFVDVKGHNNVVVSDRDVFLFCQGGAIDRQLRQPGAFGQSRVLLVWDPVEARPAARSFRAYWLGIRQREHLRPLWQFRLFDKSRRHRALFGINHYRLGSPAL